MIADIRYALRQFVKFRTSAVIAVISLALGIGGATAVFSIINGVLVHPFPYAGADRMITLRVTDTAGYNGFSNYLLLSTRQFQEIQKSPVLDGAIATDSWDMAITGEDLPEAVHTGKLSANSFEYFGVPPVIGREFTSEDGPFGQEPRRVVVLSYHFWQSHYGGNSTALGRTLQLDHENYTVIGVVPPRFEWFHSDVYIPLRLTGDPDRVQIIDARLKPGVTTERATSALNPLIQVFEKETPKHFPRQPGLKITRLNAATADRYQGTLILIFGAVMVLLAVGSTNVALLLLARAAGRQQELSVRAAIGATRTRLIRQLVTEAVLLAMAGCLAGAALAYQSVPRIVRGLPENSFPNAASIQVDTPVLLFAVAISLATGLLCGLWPAIRSSRPDIARVIQSQTARTSGTRKGRRYQTLLIAGQAALTVVLLAAAGASIRAFLHLYQAPLGFDPKHLLTVALQFPDGAHTELNDRQRFYTEVRERVAHIPGVKSAAIYPFGFPPRAQFIRRLELFDQPSASTLNVATNPVSREFFETLKIPILQGAVWSAEDTARAAHVAVVNQAFVRGYWPAGDALGRKIRLADFTAFTAWMLAHAGSNDWLRVLGVVGDTPNDGLSRPAVPAVYLPYSLVLGDSFNLAVRTAGNPLSFSKAIREEVHRADAGQPVNEIRTAEDILADEGWATEKFVASLFAMFSALALVLAAIGLFSVISVVVAQRYQELGIRFALGASRRSILLHVLFAGTQAVVAGMTVGVVACLLLNGVFRHWTQADIYDPVVILCVGCVFLFTSAVASLWPAWKASGIDPMTAFRRG
jgi:predicted permease